MSNSVVELFAGVGGFHLAAKASGWEVIWANQWEPGVKVQHAFDCYVKNFPDTKIVNEDIATVIDQVPEHTLLTGGFPCQDYSVAKGNKAEGIKGRKGILWWEICKVVDRCEPSYILLENVDRLLKSPTNQRGRDFAIMLASLDDIGYSVEWRNINAADYGYPQKRRRVFIFAWKDGTEWGRRFADNKNRGEWLASEGLFSKEFDASIEEAKIVNVDPTQTKLIDFSEDGGPISGERLLNITENWPGSKISPFRNAGVMTGGRVWTADYATIYDGEHQTLGGVVQDKVDDEWYYLNDDELESWKYLKGAKSEKRIVKDSGFEFDYKEGGLPFPDPLDRPARTMITGEGGKAPSRFKHVIQDAAGRLRRLTPVEAERLNGFPDDWTDTGMPTNFRYFCMGNALVVPLVARIMRAVQ